jgi:malonate-semialdehyde dehydrogenase (acetylating)/methylmalonate-semialdehyde dehydrogenase
MISRILKRRLATVPKPSSAPQTQLYINGEFINSESKDFYELRNPATDEVVTYVPQSTPRELAEASKVAQSSYKQWKKSSILSRQRIMFDLQALIRNNMVRFY